MTFTLHLDLSPVAPLLSLRFASTRPWANPCFSLLSSILTGFAQVQVMAFDCADSFLGGPSQPPDPSSNFAPTWNPDAYPLLNFPYEGYNSSQITDNGPGQPILPWQQLPGDMPGVDSTSFTALLNSPLDSFTTSLTPTADIPMAKMPVAQNVIQNVGHVQAPQYGTATGYRPQTTHVLIRPKPTPNMPQDDDSDDEDEDDEPPPKRKRRLPPYLREIQAQAAKRQAERWAASQGLAVNPQNSTVDLTNGMDRILHYLNFSVLLLTLKLFSQRRCFFARPC